jgi:Acetyltransferase (GNAT) domain
VDPAWGNLEGYLGSLAAKRRRAVKKTFEALQGRGYRARQLSLEELQANAPRLEALYGQVWANAEVRPLKLSSDFFVGLKAQLGEDCAVLGLERDGQLDGFGVCLRSHDTCVGYYLGFDKAVEAPLYLRLLVGILAQTLAWKCARASMGRTAEEPKARLGAVPMAPQLWVKHRTPPLNWAVGAILGTLQTPEVPAHRAFRSDA